MVTLYFTRLFTKGHLKGIIHNDSITYPDENGCVEWIKIVSKKGETGKLDYIIIDKSFQKYWRY